ncbi:hypothetical protein GCM10017767_04990 [Halomonas urumqiensis]|nr:hypothetical protein GCM10017767_04990 [Halomonas urumqiensis]
MNAPSARAREGAIILYGCGNSITNHLLAPAFQQYLEIGCLFDPDIGGVRMCDTLYQRGDLPPLHFLAPADLPACLEASLRTIDSASVYPRVVVKQALAC